MNRLLAILAVGLPLVLAAAASADSSRFAAVDVPFGDLADATNATAPTAAGGHVVFSRLTASKRYELVDWTAKGGERVLPVGTRAIPFDADAGAGEGGRPVLTYSRCRNDGSADGVLEAGDFVKARGCSLRILALDEPHARPRPLRLHGAVGLSLSTPSVRGRSVAAVAAPGPGSHNARILYWRTAQATPRRLSGGLADCQYGPCKTKPYTSVSALDLGPRSVAYVWDLHDGGLGIGSNQELRSAPLSGRHSRQATRAAGYVSGACGYRQPLSPNALSDGSAGFVLAQSPCEADETTLARFSPGAKDFDGARPTGALVGGAAWDGDRVYWLRCTPVFDPDHQADVFGPNCRLVVSTAVPFAPPTLSAHG
jgi:hypothetical protein